MINSVFKTGKNYYPHVILEEYKYVATEKKMFEYITSIIEIFSDSDTRDSDEKNANKKKSDEENLEEEN